MCIQFVLNKGALQN